MTLNRLRSIRELPALTLFAIVVFWLLVMLPSFRTSVNLSQVAQQAGLLGILVCGEALVILTGGVDLSVGATAALCSCFAASLMQSGWPWPLGIAAAVIAGAACGYLNGALITYRKLPPILTTLATLLLFRAITNIATGSVPYNHIPENVKSIGAGIGPFLLFIALAGGFAVMLTHMRFGRRVIAVGASESAVRLSGVDTHSVLRRVYLLCGACAGLAGLLIGAASNSAQANLADGYELDVISAVVIGGVRLTGGEGSAIGAAIGALIIVVMRNALVLYGRPPEQYGLVTGAIILLAAFAEQMRRSREAVVIA